MNLRVRHAIADDAPLADDGLAHGLLGHATAGRNIDLEDASAAERQTFAAQLRAIFTRPAPVPDLPAPLASAGL